MSRRQKRLIENLLELVMEEFDITKVRSEFPILNRKVWDKPMVYLDSAATSFTPMRVVEEIERVYTTCKANVHRGVHSLSQEATDLQEATRECVREFINASSTQEIIFTRGTTEAINLVASSYGDLLENGDEIIITTMEHHANIVPWQLLGRRKRVILRVVPIKKDGTLDFEAYCSLFNERTKLVAVCHVSNVLGTINPIKAMINEAHKYNVPVLVDGAQAVSHHKVDVQELDADFYAFSAHKMYGPTGVGVLYGKRKYLSIMPPYQGGGEMIGTVSFKKTTYAELPFKFEAGTPDFVGIAAFKKAIEFMQQWEVERIATHEQELLEYATEQMLQIPKMKIFGAAPQKSGVISFLIGNEHHYDLGMLLDKLGVEVRTGHHCAQPLMQALGIDGTVRVSFAIYNTKEDIDTFIAALKRVSAMLE